MTAKYKLQGLVVLLKAGGEEEVKKIIKSFTEDERKEFENELSKIGKFYSVVEHEYQGYNKLFLSMSKDPGMFGTFKQWLDVGRVVKKGSKGVAIGVPIFTGKDKDEIRYMKTVYIFHENDTEKLEKKVDSEKTLSK